MNKIILSSFLLLTPFVGTHAGRILLETEAFADHGGWKLDTQFIREMGSPYLLAHGLGTPVQDATTTFEAKEAGSYQLFARTKDWVARWGAKGQPGRFQIIINGVSSKATFGTRGAEWDWQGGGQIQLKKGKNTLVLHDLTGFNGRCDAIYLTQYKEVPPNDSDILAEWRRELLGITKKPLEKKYDLVVIGGGYSGLGAAISGARMGCKVALIQDRGYWEETGLVRFVSGQKEIFAGENIRELEKLSKRFVIMPKSLRALMKNLKMPKRKQSYGRKRISTFSCFITHSKSRNKEIRFLRCMPLMYEMDR